MLKAQGCALVAQQLINVGIQTSKDDKAESEGRRAWNSVYGLGNVTWSYTRMLLGHQDVKADRMILRFVRSAFDADGIGATANAKVARSVVIAAAKDLDVEPVTLDHAIWQHQRRL